MIFWTFTQAPPGWPDGVDPAAFLAPTELDKLATLRFPKRRAEWLLGRKTAKDLLRRVHPACQWVDPRSVVILNQPEGAPYYTLAGQGPLNAALSLSHRDLFCLCAISLEPGLQVGVDLELVERRDPSFVESYFTPGEAALAAACAPEQRDAAVTLIWSAKEAMLKALGKGLRLSTLAVEVTGLDWTARPVSGWQPLAAAPGWRLGWRSHGDYVLTLAAGGPGLNLAGEWARVELA